MLNSAVSFKPRQICASKSACQHQSGADRCPRSNQQRMNIIPYQVVDHRQGFNGHRHDPRVVIVQSSHQHADDAREVKLRLAVDRKVPETWPVMAEREDIQHQSPALQVM
ncbi:MAG: hypothetical protein FRX49_02434 [Trebouxia sp. A1-2]|nr:MAG: hypothetical protein FRX49_02434 [Trebouxia sp. A1-2]